MWLALHTILLECIDEANIDLPCTTNWRYNCNIIKTNFVKLFSWSQTIVNRNVGYYRQIIKPHSRRQKKILKLFLVFTKGINYHFEAKIRIIPIPTVKAVRSSENYSRWIPMEWSIEDNKLWLICSFINNAIIIENLLKTFCFFW